MATLRVAGTATAPELVVRTPTSGFELHHGRDMASTEMANTIANAFRQAGYEVSEPMALLWQVAAPVGKLTTAVAATADPGTMEIEVEADQDCLLLVEQEGLWQAYHPQSRVADTSRPMAIALRVPGADRTVAAGRSSRFIVPLPLSRRSRRDLGLRGITSLRGIGDLVGDLVGKVVRIMVVRLVGVGIRKLEEHWKPTEELQCLVPGSPKGRRLLLIHGIFSSTLQAFKDIVLPDGSAGVACPPGYLADLSGKYPGGIWAYDHWTVQKGPLQNATDLVARLQGVPESWPAGVDVDVVCHSRGAAVTRAMLEHPALTERTRSLGLSFQNILFVAGANQGSALAASAKYDCVLNLALGLMQLLGAAGGFVFVAELLKLAVDGVLSLPGIAELDPASPFMTELNKPFFTPVRTYRTIAANYEPAADDLKMAVLDGAADAMFAGSANDLVVPFRGAETFDPAVAAGVNCGVLFRFGDAQHPQSDVCHTNFFRQCATRKLLLGLSEM